MKKLRSREVNWLAFAHTTNKQWSQNLNLGVNHSVQPPLLDNKPTYKELEL